MPANVTKLDVWNMALDHLVEHALNATTDASTYARWLRRNHDQARDAFLRLKPWNFAMQLNTLTVDNTAPAFRWDYRFPLPSDWIRIIPPTQYGERTDSPIPFEVIGGYIYVNDPPTATTLYLRTIQRVEDFTEWDPLAVDAFSIFLAHRLALRATGKATYKDRLLQDLADALRLAADVDTLEGSSEIVEQHDVIDVRYV